MDSPSVRHRIWTRTYHTSPRKDSGENRRMIEFEIDANLFSKCLDAMAVINNEPAIIFEPAGVSIVTVRPDQVVLAQLQLRASEFEVYDVGDKRTKISLNTDALQKYMRGVKGIAMITIDQSQVTLMLPSKYGFKTFDSPLLGELPSTLVPKKLDHDSTCKIEVGALQGTIKDASIVESEYIRFYVNNNHLDAIVKGDRGTSTNTIEEGKGIIKSQFNSNAKFSVVAENFAEALKVGSAFTNILKFSFSKQLVPQWFDFQVPFDGTLGAYLAPLVDTGAE